MQLRQSALRSVERVSNRWPVMRDFVLVLVIISAAIALLRTTTDANLPIPIVSVVWHLATDLINLACQAAGFSSTAATLASVSALPVGAPEPSLARDAALTGLTLLVAAAVALNLWLLRRLVRKVAWHHPHRRS